MYVFSITAMKTDFCFSLPCQNKGICHNAETGYHCKCPKHYQGHNCTEGNNTIESLLKFLTDEQLIDISVFVFFEHL